MSLLLLFWSIPAWAELPAPVSLLRHFTTTSCSSPKRCKEPEPAGIEHEHITLELKPFRKGGAEGWHAWDRSSLTEEGITFKSEILVVKHAMPDENKYFIYLMLRSGKRDGVVKTLHLKEIEDLRRVVLEDKPVKTKAGTIQAKLVLKPVWIE